MRVWQSCHVFLLSVQIPAAAVFALAVLTEPGTLPQDSGVRRLACRSACCLATASAGLKQ